VGAGCTTVGTGVGAGVATGAAGWDVHPASRIPMNRIARTTRSFFMHLFLLFRYISIFNFYAQLTQFDRILLCMAVFFPCIQKEGKKKK
jgi:hypothetical protein